MGFAPSVLVFLFASAASFLWLLRTRTQMR
jgi:hypothetical protein